MNQGMSGSGGQCLAYSYIEQARHKCVNLAHLRHDFTAEPSGDANVEKEVPQQLLTLQTTLCPLKQNAMLKGAETIVDLYRQMAPPPAKKHGIEYPSDLEHVSMNRSAQLHKRS